MTVISLPILVILILFIQYADYNHGQEETDDAEPSTSCSSPGDREEYPYSPELTEEYLLDQMIPTPVSLVYIKYHHNL